MDDEENTNAEAEAIGLATDIAVRLIQGDHGSGNCWRIAQTLGEVIEYIRDLSMSGDADSIAVASDLIDVVVTSLVYLTPVPSDEDIDDQVARARVVLDDLFPDQTDNTEENGAN